MRKASVVLIIIVASSSVHCNETEYSTRMFDVPSMRNHTKIDKENDEKILSRKRRYLIFPEGSSLQLVFDQVIPIVDYTNFLILGITVALAWELPSKPPSEQLEDIKEKLESGTPFLRKDENVSKLQYTDSTKSKSDLLHPTNGQLNQNVQYTISNKSNKNPFYFFPDVGLSVPSASSNYRKYSLYNYPKIMTSPNYKLFNTQNYRPYAGNPWTFWNRMDNNRKPKPSIRYTKYKSQPKFPNRDGQRRHYIYPIYGKRSIRSADYSPDDRLYMEYHRHSRHKLYSKIVKYIDAKGKDGEQCLFRVLCEYGKKLKETEPGSFLAEIMRTIFTFPHEHQSISNPRYKRYLDAQAYLGNCRTKYRNCQ